MPVRKIGLLLLVGVIVFFIGHPATAVEKTYTYNSEFAEGILEGLNDDDTPGQLQLNTTKITFKFVNVAATGRKVVGTTIDGTLIRIDAEFGEIIGEYRTAPDGLKGGPSRTSVDSEGNVWVANRNEAGLVDGIPHGSVVKIGIVVGGTRVKKHLDENDGTFFTTPSDQGEYLEGPFDYNTCFDRDEDGLIKTSRGLGDIRPWPAGTDGIGGTDNDADDATVADADDECILIFQRLPHAENVQHVSVDANDDVWVGGYPPDEYSMPGWSGNPAMFHKLAGDSGAIVEAESFDAGNFGCGGFGGLVDDNGTLWSASLFQDKLLYYNPIDGSGGCIDIASSYGLAELVYEQTDKTDFFIWNSSRRSPNQITKINAVTFQIEEEFPTFVDGDYLGFEDRGVAVTPLDNHVWVVKAGAQVVRRLDSAGKLLNKGIALVDPVSGETALEPTGLAVDANGKLWVANRGTNNVMRIDPAAGSDGLGAVDLTVDLPGAVPDTYGGMAGEVEVGAATASLGTWTVITDGGSAGTIWDTVTWNNENEGAEPAGSSITVEAQAADFTNELNDDANYEEISNGQLLSLTGQYIKIRASLRPDSDGTSPVFSDLVVKSLEEAADLVCDVHENGSVDLFDILRILFTLGDGADQPFDPRDWDDDGTITPIDARGCIKACTRPFCLPVNF